VEEVLSQSEGVGEIRQAPTFEGSGFLIFWEGIVLDVVLYLIVAFVTVYLVLRLNYERNLKVSST